MSTLAGVMTKFRITELSGVDNPAQEGARAAIMKRDTRTASEIAKAAADALAAGAAGQPSTQGDTMSLDIKKALGLADTATDAEVQAAITKAATATAEIEKATKAAADAASEVDFLKAKAAMTDAEKAMMDGKDKAAVCKFMALSPAERAAEIAKSLAGDETFTVEGRTIRKSAVGEDTFAILKAQSARLDAQAAEIAKAAADTKLAVFTKRATTEFAHVAGTVEERVSVLKAIDAMPAAEQEAAFAILKAAEGTAKLAFSKVGHGNGQQLQDGGDSSVAKLDAKAKEIQKANPTFSFAKAYDQAVQQNPDLYEASLAE